MRQHSKQHEFLVTILIPKASIIDQQHRYPTQNILPYVKSGVIEPIAHRIRRIGAKAHEAASTLCCA